MASFDNQKYLLSQRDSIMKRVSGGEGRVYLEFGGKLLGDFHAARVVPGYDPDVKVHLLKSLANEADIIVCIYAEDIQQKRMRADFGITYDNAALKLIDDLHAEGVEVTAVVITRFTGQPAVQAFKKRLERHGIQVFLHGNLEGYPNDVERIASPQGLGSLRYVPVTRPLVVVTGPGPNSGKMGTCLSQIYHEFQQGRRARYAKFESFPVWNLPLSHPVNIAYESATADLLDSNAIDHFHYETYGVPAVNYNRDLLTFPLLREILERISGGNGYKSPTDMGVNCIADGIVDDAGVRKAANMEIIRRYFNYVSENKLGRATDETVRRAEELMRKAGLQPEDRPVVAAAHETARLCESEGEGDGGIFCGAAIQLPDGFIATGRNSSLMHSAVAMILNAAKHLANIPKEKYLLRPDILDKVSTFKHGLGANTRTSLNLSEALIVLTVSSATDPDAQKALDTLAQLRNCDVHLSHTPGHGDEQGLRHLGCSYTYDPLAPTKKLFP